MGSNRLFLFLAVVILLPAACFYYTVHEPVTKLRMYKVNAGIGWSRGPEINLNSQSMTKLDHEVADLIKTEAPDLNLQYPMVAISNRGVQVLYLSDRECVSVALRKKLHDFLKQRIVELAWEQAKETNK